jgi:tetratricopeptide (TPR) repeat protein
MRTALLVELFQQLPALPDGDFLGGRSLELHTHLERFRQNVGAKYTEGTLQRLLLNPAVQARRAALLALGLVGTMRSNADAAACLHDDDAQVRRLAADALWNIWFRAEGDPPKRELQRLSQLKDPTKSLRGLNALINKLPQFAEAYNQRAIVFFRIGEYQKAVADCELALALNPHHFGAQSGMGQCFLKMRKRRTALRAFRKALAIYPDLDDVAESIRTLEERLGEDGSRDDRK